MTASELSRDQIVDLLTELGRRLAARGVHADLYLVGGAAMALQFDARAATREVDAIFRPPREVAEVARELAAERHLDPGWLNSSAAAFLPDGERVGPIMLDVPGIDDPHAAAALARRVDGVDSVVLSDPDDSYALLAEDALRLLERRRGVDD